MKDERNTSKKMIIDNLIKQNIVTSHVDVKYPQYLNDFATVSYLYNKT